MPLMRHNTHRDLLRTWREGSRLHGIVQDSSVTAIVVISAHYESEDGSCLIQADANPGLLYDYYGFPDETYQYTMPNPGQPRLARDIQQLLSDKGIDSKLKHNRGSDHGVFVPMISLGLASDRPELPILQVSLRGPCSYRDQDVKTMTEQHWELGQALRPLRSQGVLLVASGMSDHGSMRQGRTLQDAKQFDDFLHGLAAEEPEAFRRWSSHPAHRLCHPRPEHFLPLVVAAGASSGVAEVIPHDFMGTPCSHFIWKA